jgi:hypothetical protein
VQSISINNPLMGSPKKGKEKEAKLVEFALETQNFPNFF